MCGQTTATRRRTEAVQLTLPRVADVKDGLESYVETKERAEELDQKIRRIDEIVYELYGLTDEEIEIVEESVGD